MNVTKHLSAVHRTILEACRTLCIWIVQLFIKYVVKWKDHGEEWNDWSYMQAGGFVLLIFGSLIYNKIFKVPGIFYEPPDTSGEERPGKLPPLSHAKGSPRVFQAVPSPGPAKKSATNP